MTSAAGFDVISAVPPQFQSCVLYAVVMRVIPDVSKDRIALYLQSQAVQQG
jgi:hypothetical protein